MVKKYCILFVATAGILISIFWYGSTQKAPPTVDAVVVRAQDVQTTVLCNGKVEDADSQEIYSELPVVPGGVLVQEGDTVRKGDILMTVDQEATVRLLTEKFMAGGNENQLVQVMAGVMDAGQLMDYLSNPEAAIADKISLPENIIAPANGIIRSVQAERMTLSGSGTPLFVLASSDQLRVRLSVNETVISEIKPGQTATITGVGFKDSTYSGVVTKIASSATQKLNGVTYETVVEVLLNVTDPGEDLKPGLSASAKIVTGQQENVVSIPYEAIRTDDDGTEFVFCCKDGKAVKTLVTLGAENESGYTVLNGLSDGDVVITSPELVEDQMTVRTTIRQAEDGGESDAG